MKHFTSLISLPYQSSSHAPKLLPQPLCSEAMQILDSIPAQIHLRSTPRLGLRLSLLLLLLLNLLLLLLILFLILPLQRLQLLLRLRNNLEEPLQSSLLSGLQILREFLRGTSDSVLGETFLGDEELDEAIDVGCFPFEITFFVIGWSDVGVEEELTGIGEGPVLREGELGFASFDCVDEFL